MCFLFLLLHSFMISFFQDQTNIETKIKNIRFIGELCKFKIASAGLVFSCLKVFWVLHRLSIGSVCTTNIKRYPVVWRILVLIKLASELAAILTYISLLQYIRKLIFSDLDKSTVEHVLRQLRKLPWSECDSYILKCFLKVHKGKYSQVHLIALLTAGLARYHDEFAVALVDEVSFLRT
ncbi:hypothetical protein GW17_00004672 [Ensete ventricosum]|nr:hypothetical protein GW17_00004672 [Ensete ventricosum]